jgi:DNA-binding transcriptional ArsR family regulator
MMSTDQQARSRHASPRVRHARDALLDGAASELLQSVRDILCEPTRTQIVRALSPGPLSVGDLAASLGRSKSATSQHLRVLRAAGIVTARRRGRVVMYSLASGPMVEATVQVLDRAVSIAAA